MIDTHCVVALGPRLGLRFIASKVRLLIMKTKTAKPNNETLRRKKQIHTQPLIEVVGLSVPQNMRNNSKTLINNIMKKTLLLIASVALTMAACTNDVAEPNYGDFVKPGEVAFTATSVGTRTTMTPNADGSLEIAWVGGEDQIGIFANDEASLVYSNAAYTAASSGAYSAFKAGETAIEWGTGVHNFYAYYPYAEASEVTATAVPASIPAVQTQAAAGDLAHIQPLAFMYASKEAVQGATVDFAFANAFSVLEVKLCTDKGTAVCEAVIFRATDETEVVSASNIAVNLTNGALDFSAAETDNEIRVNLAEAVELNAETPAVIYAMITPGHGGKQFQAVAVVDGEEVVLGEMGVPESGIPAGRKATLSLNAPGVAPVVPVEAVDLCADGRTANTYIVPAAGKYSFKATVKGNGYTGAIQSGRYGNADCMHTFVNGAAGADQTSVDLAPASAEVLWFQAWCPKEKVYETTCPIDPASVALTAEGNIEFSTTETLIPGNAVIAAKDAAGNIIWSWHIWISEGYNPEASQVAMGVNNIVMMDRNIGANIGSETGVSDAWIAAQAVGMMYQHGRKDPFPGPFDIDRTCGDGNRGGVGYGAMTPDGTLMYGSNGAGSEGENGGYIKIANTNYLHGLAQDAGLTGDWAYADGVAYANANPHRLIHNRDRSGNNGPYDWWGYRGENSVKQLFYYWGGPQVWPTCANVVKTIYDPCPAGWVVPGVDFSSNIANESTVTAVNFGWNVVLPSGQTAYFPKTGVRWGDATQLQKCNVLGAYWVNAIGDAGCGAMNFVNDGDQNFLGVSSIYATENIDGMNCLSMGIQTRSIRCVKDNNAFVAPEPEPEPEETVVDLSAKGTANTYVVNAAATEYKFKATVKGNGTTALSGDNATVAPTKARILWAQTQTTTNPDTPGWPVIGGAENADNIINISSVTLKDGYVYFTTCEEMYNGNVGIVATDDNDNVLWSWHLWVCNGYDPAATDVYVATKGINTYFMDRNLGAFCNYAAINNPDANDHVASRGLYYQWGRKDPFIGHQNVDGYATTGKIYDAAGTGTSKYICYGGQNLGDAVFQGKSFDEISGNSDINQLVAWTVANPNVFVQGTGGSGYTWVGGSKAAEGIEWTNLWGNAALDAGLGDKGGVKTMYDPCPVGYRVPSTGHYTFITSHGDQSSTGYGNPFRNWQYNCVEKIWDENGAAYGTAEVGNWAKEAPYGLNFYSNGVKTKSEGAQDGVQDYGTLPADQSTIYFPAQGWIPYGFGCSSNGNEMQYQTNRPANGNVNCYRMACTNDGNFYYGWTKVNWGQAMGLPVRCVRE